MQRGWILCQKVMVQVQVAKGPAQDVVWGEAKARVKAEWVDRLPRDRVEVVCVRIVEQRLLILPDNHVMQ